MFIYLLKQIDSEPFKIVLSAFCGGLFAGIFSNYFESKRRILEKRMNKYFEHKNTLVQIEHEIIPTRASISRNLISVEDALKNINDNNVRLVLRLYRLDLSTGLSLKIINKDLINLYSATYVLIQSVNADIQFINDLVNTIAEEVKDNKPDMSKIKMYIDTLHYLKSEFDRTDEKTLELVSKCKAIFDIDEKVIKDTYAKHGGQIEYNLSIDVIKANSEKIEVEENREAKAGEEKPKFIAAYLDIKRVV